MFLGLSFFDWFLITAWVLFIALIGPWLISAPSTMAVVIGIVTLVTLVLVSAKRLYHDK